MTISKKKESLKKNQCIHLATIAASLAVCSFSEAGNNTVEYSSPVTAFVSVENCSYPVGYKLEDGFMEAGPGGGA